MGWKIFVFLLFVFLIINYNGILNIVILEIIYN